MKWTLGQVESFLKTEEKISIIFAIGLVVVLTLVSGSITQRIIGRPLEALAGAMRDVEGGDLSRRIPVDTVDEMGRLSQGFNRMLGAAVAGRRADPRVQPAPRRRDRSGDARPVREERDAGAAQPPAQRHAPRQRVEGPPRDAGAAGRAARARDRHAAVVGVRPRAAGAARARAAAGAARAARRVGARDRTHQQDRARLPRFDAPAGAGAPADRAAAPAGGGGRDRAGRRAREAGAGRRGR